MRARRLGRVPVRRQKFNRLASHIDSPHRASDVRDFTVAHDRMLLTGSRTHFTNRLARNRYERSQRTLSLRDGSLARLIVEAGRNMASQ